MTHDFERDPERETAPPPELKARVLGTLRRDGTLGAARREGRALRVAAAILLFAAGGVAGGLLAPWARPGDRVDEAAASLPRYLIVLEESEGFRPDRPLAELVREYGAWAGALEGAGRLLAAERLDGWSAALPEPDGGAPLDTGAGATAEMSGFFLVRAEDRERALALARTHPHLGYGGRIVVLGVADD